MVLYKIVCCPKCHKFQITTANKILKCIKCQKTTQIKNMKMFYTTDSGDIAKQVLQKINQEREKQNINNDFEDATNLI